MRAGTHRRTGTSYGAILEAAIGCARRLAHPVRFEAAEWFAGLTPRLVEPDDDRRLLGAAFPVRISHWQPFLPTAHVAAKVHNIRLVARRLENLPIPPGSILSFWRIAGAPDKGRGFLPGRSLIGGELDTDYGGGLCQLSGLIYHLCLLAGLEIHERHPHSRDIYTDATRYAPLGSDAAVAHGIKDLRVINSVPGPICFRTCITTEGIRADLCSAIPIDPSRVQFIPTRHRDGTVRVETLRQRPGEDTPRLVDTSVYRPLPQASPAPVPEAGPGDDAPG